MEKDRLNIYLSAEIVKAAKIHAIQQNTSLSRVVEQLLRTLLDMPVGVEVEAK